MITVGQAYENSLLLALNKRTLPTVLDPYRDVIYTSVVILTSGFWQNSSTKRFEHDALKYCFSIAVWIETQEDLEDFVTKGPILENCPNLSGIHFFDASAFQGNNLIVKELSDEEKTANTGSSYIDGIFALDKNTEEVEVSEAVTNLV